MSAKPSTDIRSPVNGRGATSAPILKTELLTVRFGGLAALLGMLNSCVPGVVVVNIDNGFGAGYAAHLIASEAKKG